jgi:peptide deformylase
MARLNIIREPHPLLRKAAKPVTDFNARLYELLDDMTETMLAAKGVGLAAPQVGVLYRAAILHTKEFGIIEIVNPVIKSAKKFKVGSEGCLSCPGVDGNVRRPRLVTLEFYDRHGNSKNLELSNIDAVIASHEVDHLDGILFIDKLV